jgi:pimeloyl-ACP methyl ester carboxylesterase
VTARDVGGARGPSPVVLVHGGRFAASCWDLLLPFLEPPLVAVDLPGRGTRHTVNLADVGVAACTDAVMEEVGDWRDIVVVGHSLAGVTLPSLAGALGDRLAALVFVSAAVPGPGQCVLDTIAPELRRSVEMTCADGVYRPVGPSAAAYLCYDMNEELAQFTMACQVDESYRLLCESVDLTALDGIPTTYVRLANDITLLPTMQDAAIAALGHPDVVEFNAGHMAMISQPEALAGIIARSRQRS